MKYTKCLSNRLVAASAALALLTVVASLHAQTKPGKAEVRTVIGTAHYSPALGAPLEPLKVNMALGPGATVKAGPASVVELFMGRSAGTVRVTEKTTLTLDKFGIMDIGPDTVVEVQLNVPEGTILGKVGKLATASKYEIKVPNGVAGIRGPESTIFGISSSGDIVCTRGTVVFVYIPPDGGMESSTIVELVAPPPVYFSLREGAKRASKKLRQELGQELEAQFKPLGKPGESRKP